MNISYDLWPIWCDYLEEKSQNTELLRYVMTWQLVFLGSLSYNMYTIEHIRSDGRYYGNGIGLYSFFFDKCAYGNCYINKYCYIDDVNFGFGQIGYRLYED